jgi:hypothetical protein
MKKKFVELTFISRINRDGSGTTPVTDIEVADLIDDVFEVKCLSLTLKTYISCGFNSYVVKLK